MKKYLVLLALVVNAGFATTSQSKLFNFKLRQLKRQAQQIIPLEFIEEIDTEYKKLFVNVQSMKSEIINARKDMPKEEHTNLISAYFALIADIKTLQAQAYKTIAQAKQKEIDKLQRTIKLLKSRVMSQKRRFSF